MTQIVLVPPPITTRISDGPDGRWSLTRLTLNYTLRVFRSWKPTAESGSCLNVLRTNSSVMVIDVEGDHGIWRRFRFKLCTTSSVRCKPCLFTFSATRLDCGCGWVQHPSV
jgi:hypothetical protein